jgi:serine protease
MKRTITLITVVTLLGLLAAACGPESTRDSEDPQAVITAPLTGAQVDPGAVTVTGTATDNVGVTRVEILVDGAVAGTAAGSDEAWTFEWTANVTGTYQLVARAHDAAGNTADSQPVAVTVRMPAANEPAGTDGEDETGETDGNDGKDGKNDGKDGDDGEDGKDGDDGKDDGKDADDGEDGKDGPADSEEPSVAITWPVKGSELPANKTLTLRGSATDDTAVTAVEVFADDVLLGEATLTDGQWSIEWTTGDPGVVILKAKAFDEAGNTAVSKEVEVTLVGGIIEGDLVLRPALLPPAAAREASLKARDASELGEHVELSAPAQVMVLLEPGRLMLPAGADSLQAARLQNEVRSLASSYGFTNAHVYAPSLGFAVMDAPAGTNAAAAARQLSRDSRVRLAVPSYWLFPDATPNDPHFFRQWGMDMIDAEIAWNASTGDAGIVVAVVDTGMAGGVGWSNLVGLHPDVFPNLIDGYDFVSDYDLDQEFRGIPAYDAAVELFPILRYLDADGTPGWDPFPVEEYTFNNDLTVSDFGGHGTHVAGTIGAAGNNGSGVAGVNWNVSIQPIRVLGSVGGLSSDVLAGVMYAAGIPVHAPGTTGPALINPTPARVINMSLGGGGFDAISDIVYNHLLEELGVLVVAAAGNSSEDTGANPHYPSSYRSVMAVSSVDYILDDGGAPGVAFSDFFSNYGTDIDISAPGGLCWQDAGAYLAGNLASGLCSAPYVISSGWSWFEKAEADPADLVRADGPIHYYAAGTSMAAPHVAGAAALALSIDPTLDGTRLWELLTGTARRVDDSHLIGYGQPLEEHDPFYGHGVLNLAAVARAAGSGDIRPIERVAYVEAEALDGSYSQRIEAEADLTFSFTNLPAGDYAIRAGVDADGNGMIGESGEYYGEFDTPVVIENGETIRGDISVILRRLP